MQGIEEVVPQALGACSPESFRELKDLLWERVFNFIANWIGDSFWAKELANRTLERVEEAFLEGKFEYWDQYKFLHWLWRVTTNLVIDEVFRGRAKREAGFVRVEDLGPFDPLLLMFSQDGHPTLEELKEAESKLTEGQRLVLELRFRKGFSNREVALKLGKSEGGVKALCRRGLSSLSSYLGMERTKGSLGIGGKLEEVLRMHQGKIVTYAAFSKATGVRKRQSLRWGIERLRRKGLDITTIRGVGWGVGYKLD